MTNANDFAFNDTATRLRETSENGIKAYNPPLSKREYFAAMAMQGLASNHHMIDTTSWEWLAKESVNVADALIKALNETE